MRISDWSSDVCSSDLVEGDEAVLDILQRHQHRLAIGGERRFRRRFLRAHLGPQPSALEQALAEPPEDPAGDDVDQPADREGRASDVPGQPEARIKLRLRDADPRRLTRQRALTGTHVRALAKRIGWEDPRDADRKRVVWGKRG